MLRNLPMKKLIIGGISLLIVIAIAAAVLFFLFLRGLDQPGEATAQYVPDSALVYISLNLRPGAGQLQMGRDLIDRLQTDDFLDLQDELLDEAEDETGIHFLDDVSEWLGTDVSLVFLNVDYYQPEWVLMAQVGDRDGAADFMDDLASYLEDELYTEFDTDRSRGVDLWVADDEDLALGLTDDYLFVADSEDTIEEMVDNIDSPPSRSLAASQGFKDAQESLPSDRFMFAFTQVEDLLDTLEEEAELSDEIGEEAFETLMDNTPEYAAASASFIDDGIRFDFSSETPSGLFIPETDNRLRSPEALPADTLVLFSGVGADQAWEELTDQIEDLDPYTQEDFEEFLEEFEDVTDVDLERDLIDSLTGEIAFALLPGDFGDVSEIDLDDPGDFFDLEDYFEEGLAYGVAEVLLLAGVQDAESFLDVFDTFADLLEDEGVDIDRDSLGEYEVTTTSSDELFGSGSRDYEPGYVVTDEWAVLGSNIDGLEAFHDAATGVTDTLGSQSAFRKLSGMAPEPLHYFVYADLAGVLEEVEDALDDYDREDYQRDVEPFVEQLGSIMLAASITDTRIRLSAVVTLGE